MEVQGTVIGWKDGVARVQIAAGACSACEQDCPARAMALPGLITAEAPSPLQTGQTVQIDVALPSPLKAITLAFLLPLGGFLVGLIAGSVRFGGAPLPTLGLALAGTALAYAAVAAADRHRTRGQSRVVEPGGTCAARFSEAPGQSLQVESTECREPAGHQTDVLAGGLQANRGRQKE